MFDKITCVCYPSTVEVIHTNMRLRMFVFIGLFMLVRKKDFVFAQINLYDLKMYHL